MSHRREKCQFSWYVCQMNLPGGQGQWSKSLNKECGFNLTWQHWCLWAKSNITVNTILKLRRQQILWGEMSAYLVMASQDGQKK